MMQNIEKIELIYRLMNLRGIGTVQTNRILSSISSGADVDEIRQKIWFALNEEQRIIFNTEVIDIRTEKTDGDSGFISLLDERYPEDLKKYLSVNTPPVLSFRGNIDLLKKTKVGFSGSRKVSEKGIDITGDCVGQLTEKDVCIVSGYAAGVDFTAHYTALSQGGTTIIVLPEGMDGFRIKKDLKSVWDWNRVLVISEFMPEDRWTVSRAMQRNNTIIGLSDVVVVVEAGETGGSMDAGVRTVEKGKYLFVPQYGVVPESALGNNLLIKKGAFPIKRMRSTAKANLSRMFSLLNTKHKYALF